MLLSTLSVNVPTVRIMEDQLLTPCNVYDYSTQNRSSIKRANKSNGGDMTTILQYGGKNVRDIKVTIADSVPYKYQLINTYDQ